MNVKLQLIAMHTFTIKKLEMLLINMLNLHKTTGLYLIIIVVLKVILVKYFSKLISEIILNLV